MKTMLNVATIILFLVLLQGCASVAQQMQEDDFPYEQMGQVWEGDDGSLYTTAKWSGHNKELATTLAALQCAAQVVKYIQENNLAGDYELHSINYRSVQHFKFFIKKSTYDVYALIRYK